MIAPTDGSLPPPITVEPDIAGFWRRFFGNFIDGCVIGGVGCAIGAIFFDYLATLGLLGRAIGFVAALLYFVPLNSRLTGGGTLGKLLVRTRVVGRDGKPVGLGRSLVRYVVLATPFFLNGALIPPQVLSGFTGYLIDLLVLGLGGAIIYLIVFNRRTRQSLHDLAAGTYVVKYSSELDPVTARTWNGHLAVVVLIFAAAIALPFGLTPLQSNDFYKPLIALQRRLMQEPEVKYATLNEGNTMFFGKNSGTRSSLSATILVRRKPEELNQEAEKIAKIILEEFPRASQKDQIVVSIVHGFDIGIAHLHSSMVVPHTPAEWRERIAGASLPSP